MVPTFLEMCLTERGERRKGRVRGRKKRKFSVSERIEVSKKWLSVTELGEREREGREKSS